MSENRIYVEGGGGSKELAVRCREGFRKLLENAGFTGRIPRIVACGGRDEAYDDFKNALASGKYARLALIVDSEDPVQDIEKPGSISKPVTAGSALPEPTTRRFF